MLKMLRHRMQDDKGFTLIELMVVVLIIAILIAIAIPTFLGLRSRAQDRSAQSDLRNALTAAKAYYTDADTYDGFDGDAGEALEPALDWDLDGGAPAEGFVSVKVADGDDVLISTQSESTTEFAIGDSGASTVYCRADPAAMADCTGTTTADWSE
jgi:type IV pilus assembly protein PilA